VKIDWSKPGLPASAIAHFALLLGTLVAFSSSPKFEDATEAVAVDVITPSELSQITRGEKTARQARPDPKPRVDKVADKDELKPEATDLAKRDIPTPVSRPPQPEPETKPATPPEQVAAKAEPKPEPPKPEPPKPERRIEPPKPQDVADDGIMKAEKKPEPPKPEPPKVEPPKVERKPDPPKPEPPKVQPEQLAKLIENAKAAPPKAEPSTKPFNPTDIKKLLESKEKPQQAGSTGAELNKVASLGAPTASGPKLNPSQKDQLGSIIKDQLAQCWSPPAGMAEGSNVKPLIKVSLQADGTVVGIPLVANDQANPQFRAVADSAVRAVRRCSPFKIPAQFMPFYSDWKDWSITFDPREMLG
jgi:colicin import membrane protein